MTKRFIFLCLLVFLCIAPAHSQSLIDDGRAAKGTPQLPTVLISGLDAYKTRGADEAIRLWLKDGPLEGNKDAAAQTDTLRQAEASYGPFQYYEIILAREISSRTQVFYLVFNYERGPLFARFHVYRANHRWVLTDFLLSSREDAVLPPVQYLPKSIEP